MARVEAARATMRSAAEQRAEALREAHKAGASWAALARELQVTTSSVEAAARRRLSGTDRRRRRFATTARRS
jgi:hypothetical protein